MTAVPVTGVVATGLGRKDSRDWKAWSPVVREGANGEVITTRDDYPVRVVAGVFTAMMEPGIVVIEDPDGKRYTVTVPAEGGDLWEIIATAVAFPPDTSAEALASAVTTFLEENPVTSVPVDGIVGAGEAGKTAIQAATEAELRTAAGASTVGAQVFTGDAAAGREALGAGAAGDDVFQQETVAEVRNVLAVPRSLTFAQFGAVGDGAADDTAAVQAAVDAAKVQRVPIADSGGIYRLTATIDARCTVAGANQSDDFKGILGAGREATQFVMHTNNIPIFRFSGRYFTLRGFTAKFNALQTVAHTAGSVFDLEDWIYFANFDDLLIENGYVGLNSKDGDKTDVGSGWFSNGFANIRFRNNRYEHIRQAVAGGLTVGGTGNAWSNIYMSSPSVDRMFRAWTRLGGFEDVVNQLNIEQTTFEDCAVYDSAGDSLIINGLHFEGNRMMCGSGNRAIVATNGKGRVKIDLGVDECFFGPHKVSGITRSGTTATATVDLLGKPLGGHGLRVGDMVVIDGANEAAYNITATITAVPSTTTFEYTVAGSPTTPATLAAGVEYITASLGSALGSAGIQLVKAITGAEIIDMDARIRDVRLTGKNAAARLTVFRLASAQDLNARVKLRNLSTRGQIANAHLPQALDIVALSRASNVATAYTRIPHRLRVGDLVFVATAATGYQLARNVVAVTGPHSFTYNSTGTDAALARVASSALLLKTFGTTHRARTSNVVTLTLDATHGLSVGHRIRVANVAGGYTGTDLTISAVTATTISYLLSGADEAATADTGGVVMVLDPGISFQYLTEPGSAMILEEADWLYSGCEALDLGTVNAGAAATHATTHYGVRVGDRIDWSPMAAIPDGLQLQAVATAADTITWRAFNPTAGNIVSGVNLINYRFTR